MDRTTYRIERRATEHVYTRKGGISKRNWNKEDIQLKYKQLKLKDEQINKLKGELEFVKKDKAYLQKTQTSTIDEMKEELRTVNDKKVEF